jgi:putative ABC transport system permease protein
MARTSVPPASLAGAVRSALWRVDPDLSFAEVESLEQGWGVSIAPERTGAVTVSVCAALGLALAALGLFATLSYAAARRKREIGVRLAIGAPRAAIARLVVSWAGRLVALGLLFGFAGSLAAARLLRALLAEAPPASPLLLSLAAALVAAVSLAACAAPALAATRVDPMLALKTE